MIALIKKGGLRERANRSRSYQGSENTQTTLIANKYQLTHKTPPDNVNKKPSSAQLKADEQHQYLVFTTPEK